MGDGATPPTIPDDSTNSYDGTMVNMSSSNFVDGVPGAFSYGFSTYSLYFNGSNEYISFGDRLDFDHDEPFSLIGWFKVNNDSGAIVSKLNATPTGYAMWLSGGVGPGTLRFDLWGNATHKIQVSTSTLDWDDGLWHFCAMTYDGSGVASGVSIYIDGVQQSTSTGSNTLSGMTTINNDELNIAGYNNGTGLINGYIDGVAIYDKELSSPEILDIYNNGPGDLRLLSSAPDLVGWWRLGEQPRHGSMVNMDATNFRDDIPILGLPGSLLEGGTGGFIGTLSINEATAYLIMQAKDSITGAIYSWEVRYPDMEGKYYPGPNSPTEIAIRSIYDYRGRRRVS
jgi:hypothetical protein